MPNEMQALDTKDVASLLGVSDRMVRNYVTDNGLPCRSDGRGRVFVWDEVREWYVAYRIELAGSRGSLAGAKASDFTEESMEEAALRKLKAEADLKELELATKRGEVVAIADVERNVGRVAAALKQGILALPAKLAMLMVGLKTREQASAILTREADDLCRRLRAVGAEPVEVGE